MVEDKKKKYHRFTWKVKWHRSSQYVNTQYSGVEGGIISGYCSLESILILRLSPYSEDMGYGALSDYTLCGREHSHKVSVRGSDSDECIPFSFRSM